MPVFEVELSDGRIVELESDTQPDEQSILSAIGGSPTSESRGIIGRDDPGYQNALSAVMQRAEERFRPEPQPTGFGPDLGLNMDPRRVALDSQMVAAREEEVPYALRLGAAAHTDLSKGLQTPSTLIRGAMVLGAKMPGNIIARKIGDVGAELLPPDLREFRKRTIEEMSTGKDYFTGLAKWEDWMAKQEEAAVGGRDFGMQVAGGTARGFAELPLNILPGAAGAPGSVASAIRAASIGSGVTSGMQRFGQELSEGENWVTAAARGGTSGLIDGLTTRAFGDTGVESIFRKEGIGGIVNRLKRTMTHGGYEMGEEATAQVQHELTDYFQKNPNKPIAQAIRDVLLAGTVGAILGAAVGTLTSRGGQDASQKQKTAAVHGDVRQSGSPQVQALPVEEGGSGIFEETQGRVLSPDERGRLNELNNKFYGGQDMDEAEMSEHKELSDRANAKPQHELEQSEEDRIIDEAITQQGIGDKIVFVSPQEIEAGGESHPMHGRTARLNEETGKIEINRREFARNIAGLPLADQVELANTLVFHENVHSHTTPEEAEDFAAGVTKWERKINDRIYLGEKGNRVRKIIGEALGDRRTGYEMIRRRLQRMNGMTPDEILQASGREKWTLQSLDMLDRIIAQARRVTPSGRGQRAKLDDIANKIGIARQALESGAAPPDEEDAPAVMTRGAEKRIAKLREQRLAEIRKSEVEEIPQQDVDARIIELSNKSKEKALSEAEMDEMRDLRKERDRRESDNFPAAMSRAVEDLVTKVRSGEKFNDNSEAINAGLQAESMDDLEALRQSKKENKAEGRKAKMAKAKAMALGDEAARTDAANKELRSATLNQFLREAIETATSTGSHRVEARKFGEQDLPLPKMDWKQNSEVEAWLREHGEEVEIELPDEAPAAMSRRHLGKAENDYKESLNKIKSAKNSESALQAYESEAKRLGDKQARAVAALKSIGARNRDGENLPGHWDFGAIGGGEGIRDSADAMFKTLQDYTIAKRQIYRDYIEKVRDDSPAAMSRKDEKRLEELRKYQEAMGKRPETKRTVGLGEPVAPEERVSAEESGALPRLAAKDVDRKADEIMADAITPRKQTVEKMSENTFQRWKRREDILQYSKLREGSIAPHQILNEAELRAKFSEAKNIKRSYDRPGFKEFAQWAKRNVGAVSPDQLRSMWEDSVWSHLVKATPERLTEWRSALGLETKYGKGFIAPELHVAEAAERQGFFGEMSAQEANEAAKRFNRQAQIRRAQNLRGVAAAERYRNKIITAIAERLIGESITERAELTRSEITNDDINFSSDKTKFGAYYDIRADVAADDKLLNRVLRDQARSSGEPESNTRRLIAVVDRKTKEVELLSTYSDAGVQRVTDPAGARLPGKPSRELNAAFLRQYRPIASILLTDPVKGFRQNFESVSEFNEKLATEAKERSAPGEFAGEGPAGEFAAEGTPGLQGEGGSFQGPHRTTMRRGTMESTGRLTVPEAVGVLEQISNEVGFFDSADDVREALEGLLDKSARGRMKARDYLAQSAYRKMINAMQREFPDMAREDVLDRLADRLYENNASSQTLDEFTQKTVAQFKGQSAPDVGPQAAPQTRGPRGRNLTTGRLPYDYVPGEGQETPSGVLGSETPVTEPYIPEVSPEQEKIQRAAADRAGKEYGVGQDWAAAFGEVDLQKRIRKGQIRVLRDRVRRQQGIRITADEAKAILEAKKGFKQPLDMTNRGIFKRAERAVGDPFRTESPAAMSRALNDDQNRIVKNYFSAANEVAARVSYGQRDVQSGPGSYGAVWVNGSNRWDTTRQLRSGPQRLDANQIIIKAKNKREADLIASKLPPLPLSAFAAEKNPLFGKAKDPSQQARELLEFYGQEPINPDVTQYVSDFMDAIRSPEQDTTSPAAMSRIAREAIDPDIKSPIPRLVPNIATAMTRAMGIERIPLLGRIWGPRAKIQDAADRQIIGYSVKRGIGNSQAAITATRMAALDEQLGNPFEQAADGKFTNVNKTDKDQSMYPADVFRDWQRQFIIPEKMKASRKFTDEEIQEYSEKNPQKMRLNRKQEQYFREYLKYIEDGYKYLGEKNAKLEDYGGESKETRRDQQALYGLPKGLEVYDMPRVALHKRGMSAIEADVRKRIGASYQIEREQLYESEEVGAGTTVYEPDLNKRLATFVQRIYKSVADADLANAKELQGETADQRIPKLAKQYERELRLPIGTPGRMTQQDIVDMGYRPRLNKEAQVADHPAFEGKIYPIEVAKKLNKFFNDRAQRYVVTAAELNTISKTLMLTGDLAQYAQQGSLLMTRHPRIWGRATVKSLKSLANPNVTGNYLNNPENMQAATELTQGGTSLGHLQDFMSGAKPGEFLTKLPGINQVITRFGRAFGTFQDIAKIETWKAMRDTTPKEEWAEVMEGIEDLGVSGRMETAGMSSARAIGERLLLMAPAYYRGAFNTVARAASEGGVAGKEARRSLAQYAAGWTMVMVTAYLAAGMSWEEIRKRLTPGQDNQKFLKFPVKMGDETVEIGPGGIILSLLNLGVDTAVTAATDPKRTAAPAWQWLQQRLGPVPALARKAITQKDVFDRPTTPGKAMLEAVAPIPAQKGVAAARGANKAAGALSATASFVGLDAKRYKAANDVYTMAQDFIEREGLKKESGFDLLANDAPSYEKMRGAVSSGSQSDFNKVLEVMSENRSHSDIRKAMKEWRDSPFTGSEKAERMFRAQLSDYEQGIYEQAQEDRARVYDKFLDMLGEAP